MRLQRGLFVQVCTFLAILALSDAGPHAHDSSSSHQNCDNYCLNNGICEVTEDGPKCYCIGAWRGVRCNEKEESNPSDVSYSSRNVQISPRLVTNCTSPVLSNICKHNATCLLFNNVQIGCQCIGNYTGDLCEVPIFCPGDFCANNGTCIPAGTLNGIPQCKCTPEYTGSRCETSLTVVQNYCTYFPYYCKNGGTCEAVNGISCRCPSAYTGAQCETWTGGVQPPSSTSGSIITPGPGVSTNSPLISGSCATNPCRSGRPCYNTGNTFYCYCGPLHTGTLCEITLSG